MFDQAVLRCHPFCRQSQTHRYSGQKTLRYISDDNSDQEDDGIQPMIAQNEGYNEERDTKETATPVMIWMKCSISLAIGVSSDSNPEAKFAIRPITVLSPQLITIPRPVPSTQFVEKKARFFVSIGFS